MSAEPPREDENLEALRDLRSAAADPSRRPAHRPAAPQAARPEAAPGGAAVAHSAPGPPGAPPAGAAPASPRAPSSASSSPAQPAAAEDPLPPLVAPAPPPPAAPPGGCGQPAVAPLSGAPRAAPGAVPAWRCLYCGYPLAGADRLRCSECGREHDADTLALWFSGEEQRRLEHVIWLAVAALFMKLFILPQFLWIARVGTAAAGGWACYLGSRGKSESVARYYGIGGIVAAGLMLFSADSIAFYTLDALVGCALLLAVLHDPAGGTVGGALLGRRVARVLLFAAPLLAIGCWVLESRGATTLFGGMGRRSYSVFGFVVPHLAATAVWLFVWRALAALRRLLFAPPS